MSAFSRLAKPLRDAITLVGGLVLITAPMMGLAWLSSGEPWTSLGFFAIFGAVFVAITSAGCALFVLIVGPREGQERENEVARSRGATRPIDQDIQDFRRLSDAHWARLYRRHRRRCVVRGILTLLAAPLFAIALGGSFLTSEGFWDARELGFKWGQYIAAGIALIVAFVTLIWGLSHGLGLILTELYVVIGKAVERTSTSGRGMLVATEIEHDALRVAIDRCLQLGTHGHLNRSDHWSGIETFPGPSDIVEVVPDGHTVVLLCRGDGRIIERPTDRPR